MLRIASLALFATLASIAIAQEADDFARFTEQPAILTRQRPNGSWSAKSLPVGGDGIVDGKETDDLAVTSLMVLSLLGDGHTAEAGPYRERMVAALDWLLEVQAEDGALTIKGSQSFLADHALATLALSEANVLSSTHHYREAAKAAVSFLERTALESGGWSASGNASDDVDARATTWAAMAMASAGDAELSEHPALIAAAAWRLRQAGIHREELTTRDLSFELVTRFLAGEHPDESLELQSLVVALLDQPVAWRSDGAGFDSESFYLRNVLAYRSGGQLWKDWQSTLRRVAEVWKRDERNSFVTDASTAGGSLAGYCYARLSSEIYYRYSHVIGVRVNGTR